MFRLEECHPGAEMGLALAWCAHGWRLTPNRMTARSENG